MGGAARDSLAAAVKASGLVEGESSGVVLCSGGADSAALATALAAVCGPGAVLALHLNYGLRPDSDEDERVSAELCAALGIELVVERPTLPGRGNVQDQAREARYTTAERLRATRGLDWIASGHTATDLAETVIYRLAASPGTRALLGLPARRGAVVRPLLALKRERVRELVAEAGLPFRDDPSNADPLYARNRIRNEVLPVLRGLAPALEENIAETRAELREEFEALQRLASEALEVAGAGPAGALSAESLEGLDPALRRLALRRLAEVTVGHPVALGRRRAAEILRLAGDSEGGVVELGGGVEARIEGGHVRFAAGDESVPEPVELTIPGSCRFGRWELRAELRDRPAEPGGLDAAYLDPSSLAGALVVRSWRRGDRIRPLGLGGSKSLQDLFTDRRVPRSLRQTLPVVTSGERIAWIAGVAVSEEFAVEPGAVPVAVIRATAVA